MFFLSYMEGPPRLPPCERAFNLLSRVQCNTLGVCKPSSRSSVEDVAVGLVEPFPFAGLPAGGNMRFTLAALNLAPRQVRKAAKSAKPAVPPMTPACLQVKSAEAFEL